MSADVAAPSSVPFSDGLSRIDRTGDNSGFAFTALDLVDKGIASLDPIRAFPHVMFVNVSKNNLTDVTDALAALDYLVSVNLSENHLATFPKFKHAFLKDVDLSKNQLTTLEDAEGHSIVSLKLNGNQLSAMDGLANLPALKSVELARNNIAAISLPTDMPNVDHLVLSENKLTTLAGLEAFPNIASLSIDLNQLATLDVLTTLQQFQFLTDVDLTGNAVTELESYRLDMLLLLPRIKKLDGIFITDDERVQAIALKKQRDAAAAAEDDATG
ncbi:hypothetical protein H310_11899 [Aphanomyces invadans]|uniref:U2A'/phosphoprotein 32 family A C-terminal domain-containing protein n=1 Tax=Aphanomyces invadans TaxID=157072 RepID=A0A024TJM2_9STRA|nr:hypothetical protein H310_11899 [Aphanomyces invadans]ETV94194.1 hypothetical protein H310_11899 [Aphanomyces invadans]|eukprot:XP_008876956.1 hypothetical protein H310_11899 [Aphanomyces invadans]